MFIIKSKKNPCHSISIDKSAPKNGNLFQTKLVWDELKFPLKYTVRCYLCLYHMYVHTDTATFEATLCCKAIKQLKTYKFWTNSKYKYHSLEQSSSLTSIIHCKALLTQACIFTLGKSWDNFVFFPKISHFPQNGRIIRPFCKRIFSSAWN